ncbi:hypothetical protein LOCC1_G005649 [Lachnellula occidentalis]|uniref:BTB domain-containing protein n=1 Tax=Lachnellula occidentalis TaxID=215460 RepID=A0A8H8UEP2_9HELO|nr:hypothetical protein LOCC1_G005649 [Lachnellula occidentalis]
MAPPRNKKQKTAAVAASPPTPIVFQSPGLQPDVRLMVFDQEFHVHSVILKLYSAFFRKFLDSPDKVAAVEAASTGTLRPAQWSAPTKFKYEWFTQLDQDAESAEGGNWHLVAASSTSNEPTRPIDLSQFKGNKSYQSRVFEKLLCAMYLKPYIIEGYVELATMTDLADYYCALPILSRTLDSAFFKVLRLESLVWVLGPWGNEQWKNLQDPKLKKIAKIARYGLSHKISKAQEALTKEIALSGDEGLQSLMDTMQELALGAWEDGAALSMPRYFQQLQKYKEDGNVVIGNDDAYYLDLLLKSELVLEQQYQAGTELAFDHFLCVSIDDEDLPWDITEMDW